jgi:hypothetical protein
MISEQRGEIWKWWGGEEKRKNEMHRFMSFHLQFWHFCLTVRLIQRMSVAQEKGHERIKNKTWEDPNPQNSRKSRD